MMLSLLADLNDAPRTTFIVCLLIKKDFAYQMALRLYDGAKVFMKLFFLFSNPHIFSIFWILGYDWKILKYSQKFSRKGIYIKSNCTSLNFFWPQLWWMTLLKKKTFLFIQAENDMCLDNVLSIRYKDDKIE